MAMVNVENRPQASRAPDWRFFSRPGMGRLSVIVLLLVIWELAARFLVSKIFLVGPVAVLAAYPKMLAVKGLQPALLVTFGELVSAFIISLVIAVPLGIVAGRTFLSRRTVLPLIFLLYAIPQITIMPIIVMICGIGPAAKIIFGVTHAVFPIVFAVAAGVRTVDPVLISGARLQGASRLQIYRHIFLPHMIPVFFSGMRLGMVGAMLGVLLAELYVSSGGIGAFTRQFSDTFETANLFALVLLLAAMAVVLNEIFRRLERHFGRWRP